MALLKCHECGNQVSSEAKTCPKCGAKVKKPTSLIVKLFAGLLGLVILGNLFLSSGASSPGSAAALSGNLTPATSVSAQTVQAPTAPVSPWDYSVSKDKMTSKDISYASTESLNKEDLHWPYGPGIGGRLTLRKHPRHGNDVIVALDKGQILCRSYESCAIQIRFDDRPPIKYAALGPSDGSTELVFIQNYAKFFGELKKSKKIIVELPLYQDGNRSWQFKVDGLTW